MQQIPLPSVWRKTKVYVWRLHVPTLIQMEGLHKWLLKDEEKRMARFRQESDRQRFLIAHSALNCILCQYLEITKTRLIYSENAFGKPEVPSKAIQFNLSHSGEWVIIAVARQHKVGVDVESLDRGVEIEGLAKRFFSPQESKALLTLTAAEQRLAFFRVWTRKEALLKMIGTGFATMLNTFTVSHEEQSYIVDMAHLQKDQFELIDLSLNTDKYLAVLAIDNFFELEYMV